MLSFSLLILVVVTNILLASFVFMNNSRAALNRTVGLFCLTIASWSVVTFFEDTKLDSNVINLLVKIDFMLATIMILLFFWFCYSLVKSKNKLLLWINVLGAGICEFLAVTGLLVKVNILPDRVEFIQQPGYPFLAAYIAYGVLGGLILLTLRYRHVTGKERSQLQFVFLGLSLFSIAIIVTNVILPEIINAPPAVTRLGIYSALFLTGGMAYSIIKHQFMNIRLVVARSVAYGLLLTTLAGIYAGSFFFISELFLPGDSTSAVENIVNIVLVVILAAFFQPLKRFFEKITDSIFYRDGYDPQTLLSNLGSIITREIELAHLTDKVIWELTSEMKITKALIVVLDNDKIFYEANVESISHRTITLKELEDAGSGVVLKDALESDKIPELFSGKYGLSVSVDLRTNNQLVGYLLLGEKKSGDIFNSGDIRTLSIFAQELAITIVNAKSYTQIQDFNRLLKVKVEEATKQLRDANMNLQKLDGIKNEFLFMTTHQLNTPLTVVDGYLAMINDGTISDPVEQRDVLEKTLHRVRLMKRLVMDFLNVSRMETGTFIIDVKPVDLNKLVTEEVNELGPSAKEREVLLQYIMPRHPVPIIEVDEQKTRQVIMNLVDNALHYTPKGVVKVYLDSDKESVTFKVADNGIGVPEGEKNKLFQKFSRAANAKKERPNGTGVGLYLVKRVIEDQGGAVIFESQEGKGSTFGFRLPIKRVNQDATLPTSTAAPMKSVQVPKVPAPTIAPKPTSAMSPAATSQVVAKP